MRVSVGEADGVTVTVAIIPVGTATVYQTDRPAD
jgi:hypothetical protein